MKFNCTMRQLQVVLETPLGKDALFLDHSVPHKRREPQQTGGRKTSRNSINERSKNGGSEVEKRFTTIVKQLKEQKQANIKHKTKIYTEARYFALKIGRERYNKEWNLYDEFVKVIFLKLINGGVLLRPGGLENSLKINRRGGGSFN